MSKKKRNIFKYIIIAVISLVVGAFSLNYLLNQRLVKFLEKALVERTLKVTDGLYHLSFENLYIGLFNGELHLEGIKLTPDPDVIQDFEAKGELPPFYVDIHIGLIDFKGVNLVWRRSHRKLHFSTFEIKSPNIQIFQSGYTPQVEKESDNLPQKTLYELIAPYISVLTVQTMNLENASVVYSIRDKEAPIIYALDDVTFHAYGFCLDENSSFSGKLLYCDHFDFTTNQSQVLVTNNDFVLSTENISLNTKDSLIHIGDIRLSSQQALWEEKGIRPQHSLEGGIGSVDMKGIGFKREKGLNYLTARSFSIQNSSITGYDLSSKDNRSQKSAVDIETSMQHADSLIQAMSLYEITSPLLQSISIKRVGFEKADLHYTKARNGALDTYQLNDLEFEIRNFVIDSTSTLTGDSRYYQHINFRATGMRGILASRNQYVHIDRMDLESRKKRLRLEGFEISPLSKTDSLQTLSGRMDTLSLHGVYYTDDLDARLFSIAGVDLNYYKSADTTIGFQMPKLLLEGLKYRSDNRIQTASFHMESPEIRLSTTSYPKEELFVKLHNLDVNNFVWNPQHSNEWVNPDISVSGPASTDSLIQKMPIYQMLSSFMHNVSIGQAEIGNAQLHYTVTDNNSQDVYALDNFNFKARKSAAHSVASLTGKPTYYDIIVDATGIRTILPSLNHAVDLKRLALDTKQERLYLDELEISPLAITDSSHTFSGKMDTISLEGVDYRDGLKASRFHISGLDIDFRKSADTTIHFRVPQLLLKGMGYRSDQSIQTASFHMEAPEVSMVKKNKPEKDLYVTFRSLDVNDFRGDPEGYNFGWIDMQLNDLRYKQEDLSFERSKDTTRLTVANLYLDKDFKEYHLTDLDFTMDNISVPVSNGFYTVNMDRLELQNRNLILDGLHFVSSYPKMEFAYIHPKNGDWFDIAAAHLEVKNIDLEAYTKQNTLRIDEATVTDMTLQNYRNQKIPLPHVIVPMIYEGIQKAPVKIDIPVVYVNNLTVEYDELARKGDVPGKLAISEITGTAKGLTNIVSSPEQFIELKASARFMRTGLFHATWLLPVDSLYDRFIAEAYLEHFNLVDLNEFIHPLANVEIKSGFAHDVNFTMDASSKEGAIRMQMPYQDLKIEIQKKKNDELEKKAFTTFLANAVVRSNNPSKPHKVNSKLRESDMTITRDPYHSTFNYLWQLMRPPMGEAAGFSESTQNFGKKVVRRINKVKNFFTGNKKKEEKVMAQEE